ncbi:hypothetical protein NHX12_006590 [Muraenolepis orangiensis]|uniref:Protein kinase domain-containing protein n=1 Tax=Muraenolepis orangiensis TaxID=630683 RepID=A0A9Q0DRA8_9TELE|nr:hypothetical protein NHX12_006590 [Muraenolepis orangiensis]
MEDPLAKKPSAQVRGKSKKAKRVSAVSPLEEGEELTDTGTKDGRIFNEQNFLQRAAKPLSVDKWIKRTKVDFLGIPSCVGFGLHADTHRFLILPSMGQTLLSILEDRGTLSEKVVLHIACRILDVLKFIHSSEYVHGDINAENVYIKSEGQPQVSLAGYSHAFRYCPGGQHVEYRQASRIPHEGAVEYISVDSHKGAGKCGPTIVVCSANIFLNRFSVPVLEKNAVSQFIGLL